MRVSDKKWIHFKLLRIIYMSKNETALLVKLETQPNSFKFYRSEAFT